MSIKILSIKKTTDFNQINKHGYKFFLKDLIIILSPRHKLYSKNNFLIDHNIKQESARFLRLTNQNNHQFCRVGYTISKSVSKLSTTRNLVKRRIKQIIKTNHKLLKIDHDYVFIARKSIVESSYSKLEKNIIFALKKLTNHEQK